MEQSHRIEGYVLDTENNPIAGIWVRFYRKLDRIGYDITEENGRYEFVLDQGSPIVVRYDGRATQAGKLHPTIVNNLSGARNHDINVVMHKVGLAYNRDEVLEILSAYERLYFFDEASDANISDDPRSRYEASLAMIKYVDTITEQRYKQVHELYNL